MTRDELQTLEARYGSLRKLAGAAGVPERIMERYVAGQYQVPPRVAAALRSL